MSSSMDAIGRLLSSNIVVSIQRFFAKPFNSPPGAAPSIDVSVNEETNEDTNEETNDDKKEEMEEKVADKKEAEGVPKIEYHNQVFNVPGNNFTYEDAGSICSAYGARLANFDEIEDAYINGGEWCNYGWSEGQMALFPTQKETYEKLQKIEGHQHDCGRQGINGGYFANPNVKFGVNCYGKKPKITSQEETLMENASIYPKTMQEEMKDAKVEYWKTHLTELLVSPFNTETWNRLL